jgi:hypothetical protein
MHFLLKVINDRWILAHRKKLLSARPPKNATNRRGAGQVTRYARYSIRLLLNP